MNSPDPFEYFHEVDEHQDIFQDLVCGINFLSPSSDFKFRGSFDEPQFTITFPDGSYVFIKGRSPPYMAFKGAFANQIMLLITPTGLPN